MMFTMNNQLAINYQKEKHAIALTHQNGCLIDKVEELREENARLKHAKTEEEAKVRALVVIVIVVVVVVVVVIVVAAKRDRDLALASFL